MEEIRHAFCQMCGPARVNCSTLCTVRDGVWVSVEGNPLAGNNGALGSRTLCAKGQAAPYIVRAPGRLAYALRRVGAKGGNYASAQEAEAAGAFERITWDEAIGEIARVLKEQACAFGPASLGILSPQFFPVLGTLGRRFLNVHGSPNYLHSGICFTQRAFSRLVTVGGPSLHAAAELAPACLDDVDVLVVWGANAENAAVNQGGPRARLDAQARGMKVIDIRPTLEPLGAKADVWVPVRPGTDCALAMAILHVLIAENLYDQAFVDVWCYGFDELAASVETCTPAWAETITGVPAALTERVARMMGRSRSMAVEIGNGIGDQQADGHWAVACVSLIVALTGNLARANPQVGAQAASGAGGASGGASGASGVSGSAFGVKLGRIDALANRLVCDERDAAQGLMPGASRLAAPETPRWFQSLRTQEGGPTSAYFKALMDVRAEASGHLRCLIAQATNPLSATRRPDLVAEALAKLDFFVVMDTQWNPSCNYADVVLPACTEYECSCQIAARKQPGGTWLGINQQVVEPFGESKPDWQFYLDLGVAMGYGDDFWHGDMDACLREQLAGTGVTLEELRAAPQGVFVSHAGVSEGANGSVAASGGAASDGTAPADGSALTSAPVDGPAPADAAAGPERASGGATADAPDRATSDDACYAALFASLPHGKAACASEVLGGKSNADDTGVLSRTPVYRGPAEGIAETSQLTGEFPFVFSDVHAYALCQHSYYADVPLLREHQPYPWVLMNPTAMERVGVADGDWVRVTSPHGSARFVARAFPGVAQNVLMTRRGWWQPCPDLGLPGFGVFDEGSEPNILYSADADCFDPFHSAMGKQTLVRVERVEDAEPVAPAREVHIVHDSSSAEASKLRHALQGAADRGAFAFDAKRCIGCRACEVACKQRAGVDASSGESLGASAGAGSAGIADASSDGAAGAVAGSDRAAGACATTRGTRRVTELATGEFPQVNREFFSLASAACADVPCAVHDASGMPPCVSTCPTGALSLRRALS